MPNSNNKETLFNINKSISNSQFHLNKNISSQNNNQENNVHNLINNSPFLPTLGDIMNTDNLMNDDLYHKIKTSEKDINNNSLNENFKNFPSDNSQLFLSPTKNSTK